MKVDGAVAAAGIHGTFDDVFLEWCALHCAVAVELEQGFGQ